MSYKRTIKSSDGNASRIIAAVKACQWDWIDTHGLGHGFPDGLAVCKHPNGVDWIIIPIEIKNKSTHARGKNGSPFTNAELTFNDKYPGLARVCWNKDDVIKLLQSKYHLSIQEYILSHVTI